MGEISKDALLSLRELLGTDEDFSDFIEKLGDINGEVEQRGLVHREADGEDESEKSDALDPEGDDGQEATEEASTESVEREFVIDDETIEVIVTQVVAKLEQTRDAEVQQRAQNIDTQLSSLVVSVRELGTTVKEQAERLGQLEKGTDEVVTEAIMDLPPRLRERVVVTHKPSQAAGQGEPLKTANEIAESTLSALPLPKLA